MSKQADQKQLHDAHSRSPLFEIGQAVLVLNLQDGPKWLSSVIVEQTDLVSYRVQVSDQIWRRHADQLLDHTRVAAEEQPDIWEREEGSSDVFSLETPSDAAYCTIYSWTSFHLVLAIDRDVVY